MKAADIISKCIKDNHMTQTEAAAIAGMSRQNLHDKLKNRNPRFNTMTHLLDSFGYQLHIVKEDGKEIDFPEADFFKAAEKENLYYDSLHKVLQSMGYVLQITEKKCA